VSYDVITSGDDELQRVSDYLTAAQAAGIAPLVTFEYARCTTTPTSIASATAGRSRSSRRSAAARSG
jgi:hypothetical protein